MSRAAPRTGALKRRRASAREARPSTAAHATLHARIARFSRAAGARPSFFSLRRTNTRRRCFMPGFETLTLALLAWITVVVIFSGWIQGALGLGFPLLATPLIALVTDIRSAIVIVLLPCIATVLVSIFKGPGLKHVLARFWMMPLYMFVGAAIGTRLFVEYPGFPYTLLLAAVILIYLNLDRLGRAEWEIVRARRGAFGVVFGVTAGMSEGTANVAAPPLIVYYLSIGLSPTALVQALNICFLTGKSTQFATLATVGGVPAGHWVATLPLAVIAAGAALQGVKVRDRIDATTYKQWLKRALFAMAVILSAQFVHARWWG
jgi:uncharacterized protein